MLAGLFDEEPAEFEAKTEQFEHPNARIPRPTPPRNATGLSGLSNLGATCYLNALLQTLHFTPEFRDALMCLSPEELGSLSKEGGKEHSIAAVRVIPIQLQKLFSQLLLVDQESASVDALTSSFGWTNNEELQQHDVQELNRILFMAIESSLAGTGGEQLIARLYRGTSISKVICKECGRASGREEEFLDLPIALSGCTSLTDRLKECFVDMELLDGKNQYHCEECKRLVDAQMGTRLLKLPPILTFALLRFLYDFEKGERYKDISKMAFPLELDMSPYCDNVDKGEPLLYELFSVVVHSGSTHSGHYTAYIRDTRDLGNWTHPEEDPVQLPPPEDSSKVGFIHFDSPIELIQELLRQLGGEAGPDKISKLLQQQTGVSWNSRLKKQHGTLNKFLQRHNDIFELSDTNQVKMRVNVSELHDPETGGEVTMETVSMDTSDKKTATNQENSLSTHTLEDEAACEKGSVSSVPTLKELCTKGMTTKETTVKKHSKKSLLKMLPPIGHRWFEFNDIHVNSIDSKEIFKMFQGRKSAYMLFYRRKTLPVPQEAMGRPLYGLPEHLVTEARLVDAKLIEDRRSYDIAVNTISVNVYYADDYIYKDGALQKVAMDAQRDTITIEIDQRDTLSELERRVLETRSPHGTHNSAVVLHFAKHLPSGLHLYDQLRDSGTKSLTSLGLKHGSNLFLWDGKKVSGVAVMTGSLCEPILLNVFYPTEDGSSHKELTRGFPSNLTIENLRLELSEAVGIPPGNLAINLINEDTRQEKQASVVNFGSKDQCTLGELNLRDGDRLSAEKQTKKGVKTLAHTVADLHHKTVHIIVEDHCSVLDNSYDPWPIITIQGEKDQSLHDLRMSILRQIGRTDLEDNSRLRLDDDSAGLGPPLQEDHVLSTAGIVQGSKVVIEPGPIPLLSEVSLQFAMSPPNSDFQPVELIVDRQTTIRQCLDQVTIAVKLNSDEWHLKKSNWCGEPLSAIDDEEATIEQLHLTSGSLLLVCPGKLPPKGYINLPVFIYESGEGPVEYGSTADTSGTSTTSESMEVDVDSKLKGIPLYEQDPRQYYPPLLGSINYLGSVLVAKDATISELKEMISTLPLVSKHVVPIPAFIRIYDLVNGRPGKIFKQSSHTLRRQKFTGDTKVCIKILQQEDDLSPSSLILNVRMRIPQNRTYGPIMEIIFDTQPSPTPTALRGFLSKLLSIPEQHLKVAKHKFEVFQWLPIEEAPAEASQSKGSKKSKKGRGSTVNIKNSPFLLHDGDTLGVLDLRDDSKDDFMTSDDLKGQAILTAQQEEKRRKRKARSDDWTTGKGSHQPRRAEVGIKIHVPNFAAKNPK